MSLLNMHKNVLSIYIGGDNAKLFSKVITLIYTPTRNVGYLGTYVFFYPRYQLSFLSLPSFLLFYYLFIATSTDLKQYLTAVLIHISLTTKDTEPLFIFIVSTFTKSLMMYFIHFSHQSELFTYIFLIVILEEV